MISHEFYMQRCLDLAENALGNTYPNPLVGSVIVYENKIIGQGFHTRAGQPHAEIVAINSVKNKELLKKSTLYVNLEPCSHWGKTPPCAHKIVELKIPKVVIGTIDTTEKVNGKGIEILKNAGIETIVGILEKKCRHINRRFFTYHEKKRPYVILKWAQSEDGFIDINRQYTDLQGSYPISGKIEHILVHKWRTEEQAIAVGTNTIINDNPFLTSRYYYGNNPLRITFDFHNRLSNRPLNIFNPDAPTIVFNYHKTEQIAENIFYQKIDEKQDFFIQFFSYLYEKNIQSVMIEGGKKLLESFINSNNWDEMRIFVSSKILKDGLKAPKIDLQKAQDIQKIGISRLFTIYNND